MNINKKLNAQAIRELGSSIEVFKSKNDNELYYKNANNQLVNVMTDKIKAFDNYNDLPAEGVINTFYITGKDIYLWDGTSYFSITSVPVTPGTIVEFDTTDPNLGGTIFTPDDQQASNTLYVSTEPTTTGKTWIWSTDTSSYETYEEVIPDNTPFQLYGTTIDAGGNKTALIQRQGPIFINSYHSNGSRYAAYIYSRRYSGEGNGLLVRKDLRTTSGNYLLVQGWNSATNVTEEKFKVDHDGKTSSYGTHIPNVQSVVSSATVTPNANTDDEVVITAQAEALTIANPSGTPTDGQPMFIRIYDDGTARAITWGPNYAGTGLPTTTVVGTSISVPVVYNSSTSKWDNIDQTGVINSIPCAIQLAISDETTALTTGTAKLTFRMPYAMTLTEVRASLTTAGTTSGTTTFDINEGGVSVLSTLLTIDFGDTTSVGATTPAVISDSALADDAVITIDVDAITGGATEAGGKITLIGTRLL
jgi:hypothetical protein